MRVAEIADLYGSGEIRLTVWQNFIIPNMPEPIVETVKKAVRKMGFDTGSRILPAASSPAPATATASFRSTDTKGHALELINYLEKRVKLDQPVNIHLTGCPNSCAQHYMGDIGLLGSQDAGRSRGLPRLRRRRLRKQPGRAAGRSSRRFPLTSSRHVGEDASRLI